MPAYNFLRRFADLVECEEKLGTIRSFRKRRTVPGQIAYCYFGQRSKSCRLLGRWPIHAVHVVTVDRESVNVSGTEIRGVILDTFAWADGFQAWDEMRDFFAAVHGLPFQGEWITWRRGTRIGDGGCDERQ